MPQHLVGGAEAAGGVQVAVGQLRGLAAHVIVQAGEDLLAVRMADGDGADAGADDTQGGPLQVDRQGVGRRRASRRGQCSEDGGVVPRPRRRRAQPGDGAQTAWPPTVTSFTKSGTTYTTTGTQLTDMFESGRLPQHVSGPYDHPVPLCPC
jgi:hypothetical protein